MSELTKEKIKNYQKKLQNIDHHEALSRAVINNGINKASENLKVKNQLQPTFSHELKTSQVTAQQKSGRCWLFAALNTLRFEFEQDYNVKDFQFSQNYLSFWDRIEKANIFLSKMIETADLKEDDRRVQMLLQMPDDDGGQWANAVALIKKYGLVPKYAMNETQASNHTDEFTQVMGQKLRLDAKKLRQLAQKGYSNQELEKVKDDMIAEVYRMCVYAFGEPVETFDLEYRDKDDKFHSDLNITPLEFYQKYTRQDLDEYVVIANAPDRPFNQMYSMPDEDNIVNSDNLVEFLNLDLDTFKQLTLKQLLDGKATWFGCDVLQQMSRSEGLLASDLYGYEDLFDVDLQFDKAERLKYHEACLAHAMVLTGVNLVDNQPNRWKVENSWGDKIGSNGYFIMDDKWFDEYVYETVINKKYLSDDLKQLLTQKPQHLDLWDPMA